jgi:dTDP-4-amino-4,6-dideoxygalactose transaminase
VPFAAKTSLTDLAVLGGTPAFDAPLHVGFPNLGDRDAFLRRLNDALDRRWLTNNGVYCRELEERLAERLGVEHVVAVANGTLGLEIAVRALDIEGEVIVPAYTFVATAHALAWHGRTPVFCDVDRTTHNLDPARAAELVTERTGGILAVHLWGRPCPVEELAALADRHGIPLLFDAAHALGATHRGRPVGGFGRAEVFSFHATKFCNSFEGGAVATRDGALADRMRLMRNFGFAGVDQVVSVGTNAKMSEASAAMGLTSLEAFDAIVDANRRNHEAYTAALDGVAGVRVVPYDPAEGNNYQYVVVEIDEATTGISRDALVRILEKENVLARRYFTPGCHRSEPYRTCYPDVSDRLPNTEWLAASVLALPTGTAVSPDTAREVGDLLALAVGGGGDLARRLEGVR